MGRCAGRAGREPGFGRTVARVTTARRAPVIQFAMLAGEQVEQQPVVDLAVHAVALAQPADEAEVQPFDQPGAENNFRPRWGDVKFRG